MSHPFSIKARLKSFVYAFAGIARIFKEEHNFRIHALAALLVISMGIYFPISTNEWFWIITCIAAVLASEMFNTAIEKLADCIDPNHNPTIGKIKDVSAGAVLVISFGCACIGIIIFWPHILSLS